MINAFGIVGTFGFFSAASLLGGIYFIYVMRSTQGLTSSACKQVYWPDDLKQTTQGSVG